MRNLAMFVFIIITGLFVVSCGGSKPTSSPAATPATSPPIATALDAKKLYDANCVVCHGPNRQGISGLGPALTPTSLARLSHAEIENIILKGIPNTAMAGFEGRLSPEEIEALHQFVMHTSP